MDSQLCISARSCENGEFGLFELFRKILDKTRFLESKKWDLRETGLKQQKVAKTAFWGGPG